MSEPTQEIRRRIASLPETSAAIATRAAPVVSEIALSFWRSGQAPNGSAFLPTARGPVSLFQGGALASAATTYKPTGTTLRANAATVPHAKYHFKRGYMPKVDPPTFKAAIDTIAVDEIDRRLRGAA